MLISITGGSGSGKSYIAELLASLDERIIHLDIDQIGHNALAHEEAKAEVVKRFAIPLTEKGEVDRKKLGDIVFNNRSKMKELEEITWHYMEQEIDEFINNNPDKIIILDWILIPRTKYFNMSDLKVLVDVPLEIRMARAMDRDHITSEKFLQREQATVQYDKTMFDYVINNYQTEDMKGTVKRIYDKSVISR